LDFSAILAAGVAEGPSVVQIRTQDLLSDAAVTIVAKALEAHRDDIERGALLSIDEAGTRAAFRERNLRRITISTSWPSAVNRLIKRSTEKSASL